MPRKEDGSGTAVAVVTELMLTIRNLDSPGGTKPSQTVETPVPENVVLPTVPEPETEDVK